LLSESIARILAKKAGFEIVEAQAMGSTSYADIVESGAEVLVLDSLEFLFENQFRPSNCDEPNHPMKCVLVGMEDDPDHFLAAIRHEARGYVLQEASAIDVVAAIQMVARGKAGCPPPYMRVLFDFIASQLPGVVQ
jgi:DNA-binding NarL/FixJ family response regulator